MKPGFHRLFAPTGASAAALLLAVFGLAGGMVGMAEGQETKEPEKKEVERTKDSPNADAAPTTASLDAPPKAIRPPEGLKPPFILDKITYTEKELEEIASALASVELDFFDSAGLRRPLRERATFLAALLRPANVDAVRAFHKLTGPDPDPDPDSSGSTKPVGRFKGSEELSLVLTLGTKAVGSAGASFDDLVLSTHLFDLASKIDSANIDASERLADLRAAGHRTQWNRIVPPGDDPANTTSRPPDGGSTEPNKNEKLPVELKRWKNAASAFVIHRKNPLSRGSRKQLVTANVVKRDTSTVVVPGDQPDGRPVIPPKKRKPERPMEIQMVTEGSFELLQMFAAVEGFVESRYQTWPNDRDIEITFEGGYPAEMHSLQEATCALLVDSLLSNRPLDGSVIAYSELDDRGGVLPVKQFPSVVSEAAKHFRIGQTLVVGSVAEEDIHDALLLYGPKVFLKVDVIAVNHFDKLVEVAESPQLEQIVASRRLFHEFQRTAARTRRPDLFLKTAAARNRLSEILKILPDHVSATALSQYARGVQAQKLTIHGTYDYLDWISGTAIYYASKNAGTFRADHALQANAGKVAGVRRLRPKFDKQVHPLVDIFIEFGEAVIDYGGISDSNSREGREALRRRSYYSARFHQYLVKLRDYVNANPGK